MIKFGIASVLVFTVLFALATGVAAQDEQEKKQEGRPNLSGPDQVDNQIESDTGPK